MTFAKQFQEEHYAAWSREYVDYQQMKQALRVMEPSGAAANFSHMFETELNKVTSFMRTQQTAITADVKLSWGHGESWDDLSQVVYELRLRCPPSRVSNPASGGPRLQGVSRVEARATVAPGTWKDRMVDGTPYGARAPNLVAHCLKLVQHIHLLRSYAELNATALRKIVEKFDKQFHTNFYQAYPHAPSLLHASKDIDAWLLAPAWECLKLVHVLATSVEKPMRQFEFWVDELRMGCKLFQDHMDSIAQEPLCQQLTGASPAELRVQVKNTFIEGVADDEGAQAARRWRRPRSLSVPTCLYQLGAKASQSDSDIDNGRAGTYVATKRKTVGDLGSSPIVNLQNALCHPAQLPPSPRSSQRKTSVGSSDPEDQETQATSEDGRKSSEPTRGSSEDGSSENDPRKSSEPRRPSSEDGISENDPRTAPSRAAVVASTVRTTPSRAAVIASTVTAPPGGRTRAGVGNPLALGRVATGDGSRWWTRDDTVCALSGFPVRLLPYPPFKFKIGLNEFALIDGQFLVLRVLTTWQFEALGRALMISDVTALDKHVKQCKLGPWRLSSALDLFSQGPTGQTELEQLRSRARRKLEALRHIQRMRLSRESEGSRELPPPPLPAQ